MTVDRRAVVRLLGVAGLAVVAAPAARATGWAMKALGGRAPSARNMGVARAAAPGRISLVIVDSYNDFLSEEGLTWPMLKLVAEENDLVENLLSLVAAARAGGVRIAFAPHHRYREGSHSERRYLNPSQYMQVSSESFAEGRFGGQFYPGLVDAQNGFLTNEPDLSESLAEIVDFARGRRYRIVYSSSRDGGAIAAVPRAAAPSAISVSVERPALRAGGRTLLRHISGGWTCGGLSSSSPPWRAF